MMTWLAANIGSLLVGAIVASAVALVIISMLRGRKSGSSCAGCSGCDGTCKSQGKDCDGKKSAATPDDDLIKISIDL